MVAAAVTGGLEPIIPVLTACLSGAFIAAGANAVNDVFDIEIDRINRPDRPLPRGVLGARAAMGFAITCFLFGISLGAFISLPAFFIAVLFSILLFFYSAFFKRTVLIGNFVVSLSTAAAFVYGGVATNHAEQSLYPALFAFFMHFGREIIKDMEDIHGDEMQRAMTLPVRFGLLPAQWLVTFLFLVLAIVTWMPFALGVYNFYFFLMVLLGVYPVLLYCIVMVWRRPEHRALHKMSILLKADMFIGLLAILIGRS